MCPFIYIDGPLIGMVIDGDFRMDHIGQYTYYKCTYAAMTTHQGIKFRMYCDVAHSESKPTVLPEKFYGYVKTELFDTKVPLYIPRILPLPLLNPEGKLEEL